jgi:hypothetical protein
MGPHGSAELVGALITLLAGRPIVRCSVTFSVNTPSLDDTQVYVCLEASAATELNQTFPRRQPRQIVTRLSPRECLIEG